MIPRSPVYRAQCRSWYRALELCRISPMGGDGVATSGAHVLATFRAFPQYRTPQAQALRLAVANLLRAERAA